MADLSFAAKHVMRLLISNRHDHCCVCVTYPLTALEELCDRGWMRHKYQDVYCLTLDGKAVTLRDLR